jgi:hypothetical protein
MSYNVQIRVRYIRYTYTQDIHKPSINMLSLVGMQLPENIRRISTFRAKALRRNRSKSCKCKQAFGFFLVCMYTEM